MVVNRQNKRLNTQIYEISPKMKKDLPIPILASIISETNIPTKDKAQNMMLTVERLFMSSLRQIKGTTPIVAEYASVNRTIKQTSRVVDLGLKEKTIKTENKDKVTICPPIIAIFFLPYLLIRHPPIKVETTCTTANIYRY